MKASLVTVLQLFKVKLTDGFGIWLSFSNISPKDIAGSTPLELPLSCYENKL
jgi:hypothetical protein